MFSIFACVLAAICLKNPYYDTPRYPSRDNLPSSELIIRKKGFTASFDTRTKLPRWVAEKLTLANLQRKVNRANCQFRQEP